MIESPTQSHRRTFAEVNLHYLVANFQKIRALLPEGSFICPMVKANAYGHGDIEVSRVLRIAGAVQLGVGLIEEGQHLRTAGDTGDLLLMGTFDAESAPAVLEHKLIPVLSDWSQLEALHFARALLLAKSPHEPLPSTRVHITFNTGMNRLGFDIDQAPRLADFLRTHLDFKLEGVATHLLRGDDAGIPGGESESQLAAFAEAVSHLQEFHPVLHALNSSATLSLWRRVVENSPLGRGGRWPLGSRPGLAIYGVKPSTEENVSTFLQPVISLKSSLVRVHRVPTGGRVSYGPTWRATRPSTIGVVPMGYGDGYFRLQSNRASVLCRGEKVKIAGNVCMDYFMIDLTDLEEKTGPVKAGEEVVLLGEQLNEAGIAQRITAQDLADLIGTIPYEILTNINERVPRIYLRVDKSEAG